MIHQISDQKILVLNGWWKDNISDEVASEYATLIQRSELAIPIEALEEDAMNRHNERIQKCKNFGNQIIERSFKVYEVEIVLKNNYTPLPGECKLNGISLSINEYKEMVKFIEDAMNATEKTTVEDACNRKWD